MINLLLPFLYATLGLSAAGGPAGVDVERTTKAFDGVRAVALDVESGDVAVRAQPGSRATVTTTARWSARSKPTLTQRVVDGVLVVKARCPDRLNIRVCWRDVTVNAPPQAEVTVRAGAGDVDLAGMVGATRVDTTAGSIAGKRLGATRIAARAEAGDVDLELLRPPAGVEARSTAGSVALTVPRGDYALDVRAGIGEANVAGVRDQAGASGRISASSEIGDVDVTGR